MNYFSLAWRWFRGGVNEIVAALGYIFKDKRWIITGPVFLIGTISLVGIPAVLGYLQRCAQESIVGSAVPPSFGGIKQLIVDYIEGLKVLLLFLFYVFIIILVASTILTWALYDDGKVQNDADLYQLYFNILMAEIYPIFFLFIFNAWFFYAAKKDFIGTLNPLFAIDWVFQYPTMVVKNIILCSLILLLSIISCYLLIPIPWVPYIGLVACARLQAMAYIKGMEKRDPLVAWAEKKFASLVLTLPKWLSQALLSLKYALSNSHSVFWGGLLILVSPLILGIPLLFGYISYCIRESLQGSETLPPFDSKVRMYREGLYVCVLCVEYFMVVWFLFQLVAGYLHMPMTGAISIGSTGWLTIDKVDPMVAIVYTFIFGVLLSNAWYYFAVTGRMLRAMNPVLMTWWILINPRFIFSNLSSIGIIGIILLIFLGFLVFTLPWVMFIGLAANAYIRGQSFRMMLAKGRFAKSRVTEEFTHAMVSFQKADSSS